MCVCEDLFVPQFNVHKSQRMKSKTFYLCGLSRNEVQYNEQIVLAVQFCLIWLRQAVLQLKP